MTAAWRFVNDRTLNFYHDGQVTRVCISSFVGLKCRSLPESHNKFIKIAIKSDVDACYVERGSHKLLRPLPWFWSLQLLFLDVPSIYNTMTFKIVLINIRLRQTMRYRM